MDEDAKPQPLPTMTPTTMFSAAVSATVILSGLLLFNRHSPKGTGDTGGGCQD
jgi:hypothetical protein